MAQVPYEFLARWNHVTGVLQGAHVRLYDSVSLKEGDAQAVAVAAASGYPLADILTALETGALLATEQAVTEKNAAISAKIAAEAALDTEKTAHKVTKAALAAASNSLPIK